MELFFWVVEVWHLFGAAATVGQKFLQMLAETREKNASINHLVVGGRGSNFTFLTIFVPSQDINRPCEF